MCEINIQYHKTKIGELILGSYKNKLCMLDYRYRKMRTTVNKRIKNGLNAEFIEQDNAVLQTTRQQLREYLCGERKQFDIPLLMIGTDFQKQVWRALLEIDYGKVATYLDLAKKIDNAKAVRAVASANGANSIGVIIPCHRIIGSNGKLVGFAGGLHVKKKLLNLEKENSILSNTIQF